MDKTPSKEPTGEEIIRMKQLATQMEKDFERAQREHESHIEEVKKLLETWRRQKEGAKRGGRQNPERDIAIAKKYRQLAKLCQRMPDAGRQSSTDLMIKAGETFGLRRSAAIEAVKRGLRLLK